MTKINSLVGMLAFAIAGAKAQEVYDLLYSDAFIVENAFQPKSNALDFDLAMHPMTVH